ncbi:MAG: mannose-1-phosphate guanylyltransferase/mannose-6-phosphate isomerase [Deltaproteobacteria bacterium]|jgi:mannose-1-phosphate guanylyltransferase/mannose-6-phosphate isomerase|nr:mannose-1-phosphate guanylyltransferase/mannose-6-phosphate isomerase [Deltaproteobacteria bacterium]
MPEYSLDICPVILSGGSGTRLWPLSRGLYPKQFMEFDGSTLFADTVRRVLDLPRCLPPLVICNQEHRFLAAGILQQFGLLGDAPDKAVQSGRAGIILEPAGRNTAPAVALAAFAAQVLGVMQPHVAQTPGSGQEKSSNFDPLLLVLPSDHRINPQAEFAKAVEQAAKAAESGLLVTFGVRPDKPETGYGYIIQGREILPGLSSIERFVEKPALEQAQALLQHGNCLWNSGMFMFRASVILAELQKFAPEIYAAAQAAWQNSRADLDFIRPDEAAFLSSPAISLDYAVMERTTEACVVPLAADWQDLGSWEAFDSLCAHDADGNSRVGDVLLLESSDCYMHSTSRLLAGIGLHGLVAVETPDAVLLMPKGRGQDVKLLLEELKKNDRSEASTHLKVHRPWGSYETLALGPRFQVKRIIVKPKAALSLQMHHHRAEHWVVVRGTAKVQLDDREEMITENTSIFVPLGTRHRLENPGRIELEMIEIQSGSYLGEDDIVRFEDNYGRG